MHWSVILLNVSVVIGFLSAAFAGYSYAHDKLQDDRDNLSEEKQLIEAEWESLQQAAKIYSLFMNTRYRMSQEAQKAWDRYGRHAE